MVSDDRGIRVWNGTIYCGDSWSKLFHAYNVFAGQVWIFVPVWVLIGPYVFFRFVQPKEAAA